MVKGLTPRQLQILQFIQHFIDQHQYAPSYREIMDHFNMTSTGSIYKHVRTLKRKGALSTNKHTYRSLKPNIPNKPAKSSLNTQLPLIGNLSIGYPLELFIKPRMMDIPLSLAHSPDNTYILQVQGDALKEEFIQDGDLLLIEARQDIQPGEVILGLINQTDSILKRYYPEGQYIRLENQHMHSHSLIVRSEHIVIQGALIGLLRMY